MGYTINGYLYGGRNYGRRHYRPKVNCPYPKDRTEFILDCLGSPSCNHADCDQRHCEYYKH